MSKYKTPFPMDLQTSKALQVRTSKYRLPFRKDQPSEDIQLTLHNISHNNISLMSEVKLPKLAVSTDLGKQNNTRRQRNHLSIHEQINMSVKSDKEEIDPMNIEILNESHDARIEHHQIKDTRRSRYPQERPKLSINSKQRRRFLSSASKYEDDDILEDYTERSDEDSTSPNKDNNKVQQKALPTIGQGKIYKFMKDDSDEDLKVWETLTKDIEKFQQKKQKMQYKQRIKVKSKPSKSSSKGQSIKENSIEYIQQELKKAHKQKEKNYRRSRSTIEKPSLYQGFKQADSNRKVEAVDTEAKEIKVSMSLIDKLKEIISFKGEKSTKKRLKMPLQFYLNSYEQIKQINPFFRKLSQLQGCILLNIGKLTIIQAGKNVYSEGDISKSIYIIIYGKILLSNKYKTLKKFALTGETLCEEQLFQNEKTYIQRLKEPLRPHLHKYQAKTLNKTCLLKIHLSKYYKMYCELSRLGYKQQFTLIDNLFRINFINKQTNLHQNQRDRIQTEAPHQRDSHKYSHFFH